jgi:hypothetical protein
MNFRLNGIRSNSVHSNFLSVKKFRWTDFSVKWSRTCCYKYVWPQNKLKTAKELKYVQNSISFCRKKNSNHCFIKWGFEGSMTFSRKDICPQRLLFGDTFARRDNWPHPGKHPLRQMSPRVNITAGKCHRTLFCDNVAYVNWIYLAFLRKSRFFQ